jgi:hypothetical protein
VSGRAILGPIGLGSLVATAIACGASSASNAPEAGPKCGALMYIEGNACVPLQVGAPYDPALDEAGDDANDDAAPDEAGDAADADAEAKADAGALDATAGVAPDAKADGASALDGNADGASALDGNADAASADANP